MTLQRRRYAVALLFVLPALINFAIFRYIPIISALIASLYEYSLLGGYKDFLGGANYLRAFQDPLFLSSIKVAVLFALVKVPLLTALSILLAVFVAREVRGMSLMRTVIFIPVVTSLVVAAMLWSMMLNKDLGLLQSVLEAVGIPRTSFLGNPTLALPSLIVMMIWKEVGFSTIIFVAGLKGIPAMFYDAAAIDGANRVQQFFHITLPLLKPITLFVIVTQSIGSLQVFVPIYVMTKGGPAFSTNAVVYYVYQYGFQFNEMGYASAMSFLVLCLLGAVSYSQFKLLRSDTEY
ncbi:MAG TPA: sugar ABC transporter permease [Chloroflexota bacterium]